MKKQNELDFRFGKFNTPDEESLKTLSEGVKKILKDSDASKKKQKITHSISQFSQTMIKEFADDCGVTQGAIVELAPVLFRMIIEKSMERRKETLLLLQNIQAQIETSLSSMTNLAPHLEPCLSYIKSAVSEVCELEKKAIESENVKGININDSPLLKTVVKGQPEIAFYKDIKDTIQGNITLEELFKITVNP